MKKSFFFVLAITTIMTVDAKPKRKKQPSKKTTTEHVDDFALLEAAIKKNQETLAKNPSLLMNDTKEEKKEIDKATERSKALLIRNQARERQVNERRRRVEDTIEKHGLTSPITRQVLKKSKAFGQRFDHGIGKGITFQNARDLQPHLNMKTKDVFGQ